MKGSVKMKNIKKATGLILAMVMMFSTMAFSVSAAEPTDSENAQLRHQIATMEVSDSELESCGIVHPDHFNHYEVKGEQSAYAACNHVGTERTVQFVGNCFCGGGWVYEVTCKPCGGFVGGMCTNMSCTFWD